MSAEDSTSATCQMIVEKAPLDWHRQTAVPNLNPLASSRHDSTFMCQRLVAWETRGQCKPLITRGTGMALVQPAMRPEAFPAFSYVSYLYTSVHDSKVRVVGSARLQVNWSRSK